MIFIVLLKHTHTHTHTHIYIYIYIYTYIFLRVSMSGDTIFTEPSPTLISRKHDLVRLDYQKTVSIETSKRVGAASRMRFVIHSVVRKNGLINYNFKLCYSLIILPRRMDVFRFHKSANKDLLELSFSGRSIAVNLHVIVKDERPSTCN